MNFTSATILLLLVMDPLGGIPLFLAALAPVRQQARAKVILRECAIAFLVLLFFLFFGHNIMQVMHLSGTSLGIAGGIILFLIALRIIFPSREGIFGDLPEGEPFVVPLAIPLIAGPSAIATVLLLVSNEPTKLWVWVGALSASIALSTIVLMLGERITGILGSRGVQAFERLMGLVLTAVAVEMFLDGLREFIREI